MKVGGCDFEWIRQPRGVSGVAAARLGGKRVEFEYALDENGVRIRREGASWREFDLEADGEIFRVAARRSDWEGSGIEVDRVDSRLGGAGPGQRKGGDRIRAQMPGRIVRVLVAEGAQVAKGEALLVMEAMKMENEIRSPHEGLVTRVHVAPGDAVETGAELLQVEASG